MSEGIEVPSFYLWGSVPVRFLATPDGGMTAERLDLSTGEFVMDLRMISEVFFNPSTSTDIKRLNEAKFDARVRAIRAKLKGRGGR